MLQVATWDKDYLGKLAYQKPSRRAMESTNGSNRLKDMTDGHKSDGMSVR